MWSWLISPTVSMWLFFIISSFLENYKTRIIEEKNRGRYFGTKSIKSTRISQRDKFCHVIYDWTWMNEFGLNSIDPIGWMSNWVWLWSGPQDRHHPASNVLHQLVRVLLLQALRRNRVHDLGSLKIFVLTRRLIWLRKRKLPSILHELGGRP